MDVAEVGQLCRCFDAEGLRYWVDGGWGVDALIGRQTRDHSDLDLAVELAALPAFEQILALQGYARADRPGDPEWNWVIRKGDMAIDLHGFWWDDNGNAVLGEASDGSNYPAGALTGTGRIDDYPVNCVSAAAVLHFRNGFAPRPKDRHDVALLCEAFGLPTPARFQSAAR